ncbi:MAG: hypothetical protein VXX85_01710 [Candidatus Margulisiibacteriota bacterium]|nr:hypothetical protein [Candidatus Margulisiibacteriota bacterium]
MILKKVISYVQKSQGLCPFPRLDFPTPLGRLVSESIGMKQEVSDKTKAFYDTNIEAFINQKISQNSSNSNKKKFRLDTLKGLYKYILQKNKFPGSNKILTIDTQQALLQHLRDGFLKNMEWASEIEFSINNVEFKFIPANHISYLGNEIPPDTPNRQNKVLKRKTEQVKFLRGEVFKTKPDILFIEALMAFNRGSKIKEPRNEFPSQDKDELWLRSESLGAGFEALQERIQVFCPELPYTREINEALKLSSREGFSQNHVFAYYVLRNLNGLVSDECKDLERTMTFILEQFNSESGWQRQYTMSDLLGFGEEIFGNDFKFCLDYLSNYTLELGGINCPWGYSYGSKEALKINLETGFVKGMRMVSKAMIKPRDFNIVTEIWSAVQSGQYRHLTIMYGASHFTDHEERALLLLKRHFE